LGWDRGRERGDALDYATSGEWIEIKLIEKPDTDPYLKHLSVGGTGD